MSGILTAVILYNPSSDLISNIKSYANEPAGLLVIDNSDRPHDLLPALRTHFPLHYYLKNEENAGMAQALNQAANFAINKKYTWLLTMDQDSHFAQGSLSALISMTQACVSDVGIFAPVHVNKDVAVKPVEAEWKVVKKTMTSGNLLNLDVFQKCGPFEEKLFIDYVDHEYNLRLRKNGYKIVRVNRSHLIHNLGNIESYKFSFMSIKSTHHNAMRRYYITRNRLYVIFKYFSFAPRFFFREVYNYWIDCLRILLLDEDKLQKFLAVAEGTRDWLLGDYGKRRENRKGN